MTLCTRCNKRPAVVFVTRMEGEKTINEGYCLTCAKEMNLKPVTDMLDKFGVDDEDLEQMESQMSEMMGGELAESDEEDENFSPGGAPAFPFLQNLFGQLGGSAPDAPHAEKPKKEKDKKDKKRRHLNQFCNDLTKKARDGQIDPVIGREDEIYRVIQILSRRTKNNP